MLPPAAWVPQGGQWRWVTCRDPSNDLSHLLQEPLGCSENMLASMWEVRLATGDSSTLVSWPTSKAARWGLAWVPSALCPHLVPILFSEMRILLSTMMVTKW